MMDNRLNIGNFDETSSRVSLAEVLVVLDSDSVPPSLSPSRKRDYRSAIKRFCQFVGILPSSIPVDTGYIGRLFDGINPVQHRISVKTLQNIKSNLLGAVLYYRESHRVISRKQPLSKEWAGLYALLPSNRHRYGLSRFIHYLSKQQIRANEVDDKVVTPFFDSLSATSFLSDKQIRDAHRLSTRLWNEASTLVEYWPDVLLSVPDYRKPRTTVVLVDFPDHFQTEVSAYLLWLEDTDLFSDHRPPRRCKPRTITQRSRVIQLAASALVNQGRLISDIRSLGSLTNVESLTDILRYYLNKYDDKPTSFIHNLATSLISIAEYWVRVPSDQLIALKGVKKKLGPLSVGMTDKNKRCLRQFDDDRNRQLLLELPSRLITRAQSQTGSRAAVTVQKAILIELLLMAPLRMVNVVALQFGIHLVKPGGRRGNYHLVVSGDEIKNEQPYEVQLPPLLSSYIDTYRERYIPIITTTDNPHLFPNKASGHKSQATLSQQLKETIKQHTGLDMTGHLFRHLSGKLYLESNPGQYETVRQLLGHKNLKTTVNFYTGIDTKEAARVFDDLILGERNRLSGLPTKRGQK